jgi:hypothetical protein
MLYRLLSHLGHFLTVEQIAQREWRLLDDGLRGRIRDCQQAADMIIFHSGFGRRIRNEYGLWNPRCPLTEQYHRLSRKFNQHHITIHDPTHPDAVSMDILYRIWEIAHNR